MRRTLAALFTVAPFVAGAIAALSTRHDMRILCMAAAATVIVRAVAAATRTHRVGVGASTGFALATVAAGVVALAFGARAVFGVLAVSIVLAGCASVGAMLVRAPRSAAI